MNDFVNSKIFVWRREREWKNKRGGGLTRRECGCVGGNKEEREKSCREQKDGVEKKKRRKRKRRRKKRRKKRKKRRKKRKKRGKGKRFEKKIEEK